MTQLIENFINAPEETIIYFTNLLKECNILSYKESNDIKKCNNLLEKKQILCRAISKRKGDAKTDAIFNNLLKICFEEKGECFHYDHILYSCGDLFLVRHFFVSSKSQINMFIKLARNFKILTKTDAQHALNIRSLASKKSFLCAQIFAIRTSNEFENLREILQFIFTIAIGEPSSHMILDPIPDYFDNLRSEYGSKPPLNLITVNLKNKICKMNVILPEDLAWLKSNNNARTNFINASQDKFEQILREQNISSTIINHIKNLSCLELQKRAACAILNASCN